MKPTDLGQEPEYTLVATKIAKPRRNKFFIELPWQLANFLLPEHVIVSKGKEPPVHCRNCPQQELGRQVLHNPQKDLIVQIEQGERLKPRDSLRQKPSHSRFTVNLKNTCARK